MKEAFNQAAKAFQLEKDVVIGNVDATVEKDLASKYGVTGYPTLKFFQKKSSEPEDYNAGRKLEDFVKFVNDNAEKSRTSEGKLDEFAGLLKPLIEIAQKFKSSSDKQGLIKEAEKLLKEQKSEEDKWSCSYYIKAMKSGLKKESHFENEAKRLSKLLQSNSVRPEMLDSIQKRLNILNSF
jgi:protein disulfide-isomerase A6